jgi:hypothetical protein
MTRALSLIRGAGRLCSVLFASALMASLSIASRPCLAQERVSEEATVSDKPPPDSCKVSDAKSDGEKASPASREREELAEILELLRCLEGRVRRLEAAPAAGSPSRRGEEPAAAAAPTAESAEKPAVGPQTKADGSQAKNNPAAKQKASISDLRPWNMYEPGEGFNLVKNENASLNFSGYVVGRYLNQTPSSQTSFIDHLGRTQAVKPRQDFQLHRVMLYFQGHLFDPKFYYNVTLWTVNDTGQVAIVGAVAYSFNKHLMAGIGWNGLPGTRSMQGSHPYWPSYDRVMADEFFRPYFTQGVFAEGEIIPRLKYKAMLGNNLSQLGISAVKLTRDLARGVSLTWQPTTGEFGPRSAFGDFENHEKLATQFGAAYTRSREDRFNSVGSTFPDNTTIRLADSLNLFETGALASGVTVQKATYQLYGADAGLKYKGFWLQAEGYYRNLSDLDADGPLPLKTIQDKGFYVQTAYMLLPKKLEIYGATSYVFSRMGKPKEFIGGANYYPYKDRNLRLNLHIVNVNKSPVSSTFGFYTGGLKGTVIAAGATVLF